MKVTEIMTAGVEVLRPDANLQDAARKMKDLDVGSMPICDGDRLIGMVTDRDITVRAVADGLDAKATTVREVMTGDVLYCFEDDDLETAADIMRDAQIRRLLVLNRDRRLVGIVSLGDLATRQGNANRGMEEEVLEDVSEPSVPRR